MLRRGEIDNLYSTMRKNQITIRGFLKLYNEIFKVNRGIVTLRTAQPEEPPAREPAPAPPRPETREERNARLDALLAASRAKEDDAREARVQRQRDRLAGVRSAYGVAPRG